jgi:hypothetical protein
VYKTAASMSFWLNAGVVGANDACTATRISAKRPPPDTSSARSKRAMRVRHVRRTGTGSVGGIEAGDARRDGAGGALFMRAGPDLLYSVTFFIAQPTRCVAGLPAPD